MELKNYVFRQTFNFNPLGHLRKKDGGECFAPRGLLRCCAPKCSKMVAKTAGEARKSRKSCIWAPLVKQHVSISSVSFAVDLKIWHLNIEAYSHNFQAEMYRLRILKKLFIRNWNEIQKFWISSKLEFQPFGPPEKGGRRRVLCTTRLLRCCAPKCFKMVPQEKTENQEHLVSERPL